MIDRFGKQAGAPRSSFCMMAELDSASNSNCSLRREEASPMTAPHDGESRSMLPAD
jgi:hypothetical protein